METTTEDIMPMQALRFGWDKTLANLPRLIPLGLVGGVLAMAQGALQRSGGGGRLLAMGVQVLQVAVLLAFVRTTLRLHDERPMVGWDLRELLAGFVPFLLTHVLVGLVVAAGLVLFFIPGVLWFLQYGLATFVVVDQALDPIAALRESRRLTTGKRARLLVLALLLLATNVVGALALGVGLLFTIPTTLLAATHVYRQLQAQAGPPRPAVHEPIGREPPTPHAPAPATAALSPNAR